MEIKGSHALPCSPDRAWEALNDPDILKASLKGCEKLEKTSDTEFSGTVSTRIGPVSARFSGTMKQVDVDAPHSCRMMFEGQGGVAGFAKGSAVVTLAPVPEGTRLDYVADAQIGGKLAQMGARLVEGTAKSMADDFFGKFAGVLGGGETSADITAQPDISDGTQAAFSPQESGGSGTKWIVYAMLAVIVLAIAWMLIS